MTIRLTQSTKLRASATLCEILFALLGMALLRSAAEGGEIRLRGAAEVSGPLVRLGDVAEIDGVQAADGQSLADLALFPSPGEGKSRLLRRQELIQLLSLCDMPVREWRFGGADTVEILTGGKPAKTIVRPALHLIPSQSLVRKADHKAKQSPDQAQPLVKRNSLVTVHSIAAGVRVTTSGKTLADAAKGQPVLVELDDNKEKVLARVVGPQLVEIRVP